MIGWIEGEALNDNLVRTDSGVGYQVFCPDPLPAGQRVQLWVTTVVRDDAITLYGFTDQLAQACFADLTKAAGVGPQLALGLLRELGVGGVARAVADSDDQALRAVKGVGPAMAKKILATVNLSPAVAAAADDVEQSGTVDAMVAAIAATLEGIGVDSRAAADAAAAARAELPDGDESAVLARALVLTREAA